MPGLDRRPAHRDAALIHYADAHANELAERALFAVAGEVASNRGQAPQHRLRPGQLGGAERPAHERRRRPAPRGLRVAALDALRLGQRITTLDDDRHSLTP